MKLFYCIIISLVFMFGCGKQDKHINIIKIGAILPLTGDLAKYGTSGKNAITIAYDDFLSKNKNNVQIIFEDDKGKPNSAITAINKLTSIDKVNLIIGAMPSSNTLAIAPIAEKNGVVLISPTSTASEITNAGDYIFRVCVSDKLEGKAMADYIVDNIKFNKIGVLYINNDYGVGLKNDFRNGLLFKGKGIKSEESYNAGCTDFKTIITKLAVSKIDILYIVAYKEQSIFSGNALN